MNMTGNKRKIRKVNGSYSVIIPTALAEDKGLGDGTVIEWHTTKEGLCLTPINTEIKEAK